jgi:hypothetical protein
VLLAPVSVGVGLFYILIIDVGYCLGKIRFPLTPSTSVIGKVGEDICFW